MKRAIKKFILSANPFRFPLICKKTCKFIMLNFTRAKYFNRLAIVVGDLQSKRVGPRSHVWSEPDMLEKAAYEFADVSSLDSMFAMCTSLFTGNLFHRRKPSLKQQKMYAALTFGGFTTCSYSHLRFLMAEWRTHVLHLLLLQ